MNLWPFGKSKKSNSGYDEIDNGENVSKKAPTPDSRIIEIMSAKTEDLVRNNPNAFRAVSVFKSNIISDGILPQTISYSKNQLLKDKFEMVLRSWADSTDCDYNGIYDLYGLQDQAVDELVTSGNVFIRRRKRRINEEKPEIPFQIQVLPYSQLAKGYIDRENDVINGIEYDKKGRAKYYYFYKDLNGKDLSAGMYSSLFLDSVEKVRAKDVCHVFRADKASQRQGISWFSPVMQTLKDLNLFMYARLKQQQNQASYSGFIRSPQGDLENYGAKNGEIELKAGRYQHLDPGDDVLHLENSATSDDAEFVNVFLRDISRGLGMDFLEYSGDYSETNYSSSRMSFIAFHRNVKKWQKNLVIGQWLNKMSDWLFEGARFAGIISLNERKDLFLKYVPPRREMLDMAKESAALINMINARLISRPQAIQEMGFDWEDVMREVEMDNERQKEIGPDAMEVQQINVVDGDKPTEETQDETTNEAE